jgi:hypothetical protein
MGCVINIGGINRGKQKRVIKWLKMTKKSEMMVVKFSTE